MTEILVGIIVILGIVVYVLYAENTKLRDDMSGMRSAARLLRKTKMEGGQG